MNSDIETVLKLLSTGKENIEKFSKYHAGMYSGPIIAQLARKSLAYIQDAESKLKSIGGIPLLTLVQSPAEANPAPAKVAAPTTPVPVAELPPTPAPEFKVQVKWTAIEAPCPVCREVSSMGLTATAQQGNGKATIELIVCSECIVQGPPVPATENQDLTMLPSAPPSEEVEVLK